MTDNTEERLDEDELLNEDELLTTELELLELLNLLELLALDIELFELDTILIALDCVLDLELLEMLAPKELLDAEPLETANWLLEALAMRLELNDCAAELTTTGVLATELLTTEEISSLDAEDCATLAVELTTITEATAELTTGAALATNGLALLGAPPPPQALNKATASQPKPN